MDVWCVYAFFCVCVVLCLGSGLVTGQSLVQGVLPSVKWLKRTKEKPRHPYKGIRRTDEKNVYRLLQYCVRKTIHTHGTICRYAYTHTHSLSLSLYIYFFFHVSGVPWLIITGSGLDDWIYWHIFTITTNYNSSQSMTV
jgi:hypothetical protein